MLAACFHNVSYPYVQNVPLHATRLLKSASHRVLQEGQDWKAVLAFCEPGTKVWTAGWLITSRKAAWEKNVFDSWVLP